MYHPAGKSKATGAALFSTTTGSSRGKGFPQPLEKPYLTTRQIRNAFRFEETWLSWIGVTLVLSMGLVIALLTRALLAVKTDS